FNVADANNYCWWNIGGRSNTKTHLQERIDGNLTDEGNESSQTVENGRTYHITIAVNNGNVKCYLDEELIHDYNFTVKGRKLCHAFEGCSNLTSVSIPESVTTIGEYAFSGCSSLTSVTIPENVTSINKDAFSGCSNLTSVTIPNSVTLIGYGAFYGCSGLTSITIPESVTSINEWTFGECKSLTSVTIPNSVTSILTGAFWGCTGVTSWSIPSSVRFISDGGVFATDNVTTITVDQNNPVYDSRNNCNAIIETATNKLVLGCGSTVIPEDVTIIGFSALGGASLYFLDIPENIIQIENNAIDWCWNLKTVVCHWNEPISFGQHVFEHNGDQCALYVPVGTKDAYIAAGWTEEIFKGGIWEGTPDKRAIDAMYELLASTNVYTQEAYDTYKALADGYMAQYEAGTLEEEVVNPYLTSGYKAANTYDDFLLSAWTIGGEQCVDYDKALYINTWSTEGIYDGSEMKVPFYEYWVGDDYSLANNTLTATVEGLTPGVYDVELLARVRLRDDRNETPIGITISVNGGDAVNLCAGTQSENPDFSRMYYGTFKATGVVGTDGILTININVDNTNCSWLAFKNVKYNQIGSLTSPDITCHQGREVQLPIEINNDESLSIAGISFTLTLPEGVTVVTEDGEPLYELNSDRLNPKRFTVTTAQQSDGSWGFRISTNNTTAVLNGTEGEVMTITLAVAEDMVAGDYDILLTENKLSIREADNSVRTMALPDATSTLTVSDVLMGDVNGDDEVDLSDAIMVIYYSLNVVPANFIEQAADMNGDGEIDLSDAITIIYTSLGVYDGSQVNAKSPSLDLLMLAANGNDFTLSLDNQDTYTGFQCDIRIPEGSTLADISLNPSRGTDHTLMLNRLDYNLYRVVVFSNQGDVFYGSKGELLNFAIEDGAGQVSVENIFFVNSQLEKKTFEDQNAIATGINAPEQQDSDTPLYDLQGRRVSSLSALGKGSIYISGNKKNVKK
ncbi:MAG: leucine-rich repeat protein, partial [Bacteroidaceae bacterium]|nr:leucine-rich repeat protein [Bacteroidaceae bacterium]